MGVKYPKRSMYDLLSGRKMNTFDIQYQVCVKTLNALILKWREKTAIEGRRYKRNVYHNLLKVCKGLPGVYTDLLFEFLFKGIYL